MITLRGDIDFAAAELVLRKSLERGGAPLVLDLTGVTRLHPVAERLLEAVSPGRDDVRSSRRAGMSPTP